MKELIQIIEQLDAINRQVIEKDNLIDQMRGIIDLVSQLMYDTQFVQSSIYLDLRAKYFARIEDYLKKINETPTITIEPQNLLPQSLSDRTDKSVKEKKTFTRDDVKAPIATDIYTAPACRVTYSRKKDKDTPNKTIPNTTTTATTTTTTIQETCTSSPLEDDAYFSFDFQGQKYYLSSRQTLSCDEERYAIYDEKMIMVGSLQGATMTVTREIKPGTFQTVTHTLRTCDKMNQTNQTFLFGSYYVERSS